MALRDRDGIGGKIGDRVGDDIRLAILQVWTDLKQQSLTIELDGIPLLEGKVLRIELEPKDERR